MNRFLSRGWQRVVRAARLHRLRLIGVDLGTECRVGPGSTIENGRGATGSGRIVLGARCELCQGVVLRAWGGTIKLGTDVFIGEYTVIYGHGGVTIGDDTLIAMHCRIVSSNHAVPDRNSRIRDHSDILLPTTIGKDVWLGAGVTVLGGVTIGDGCVVAAGAVVTKDLPPYSIAMGVPAQVVRFRE